MGSTSLQFNPSTGALGIGTVIDIIPYDTLNSGTLSFEGSAGQLFSITNNLTSGSIFSVNDVSGIPSIDVDADGTIQLAPYGTTEKVGIGTTNPTQKLDVLGNTRLRSGLYDIHNQLGSAGNVLISTGAGISWSSSTPSAAAVTLTNDELTDADRYITFEDISSGTVESLGVSTSKLKFNPYTGTLFATKFTSLSDRTQKEDITPIQNAIDTVKLLNGVKYKWKDDHNQPSIGLIAQDTEKVLPEVVTTSSNGLKSVSYGNIVGLLIEAIKEQQVQIERLEEKLNA